MGTIQITRESVVTFEVNEQTATTIAANMTLEHNGDTLIKATITVAKNVYEWAAINFASVTRGEYEITDDGDTVITIGQNGAFKLVDFRPV